MRVVAVELFGQIPLYLYAIFLGVGASAGLLWVAWRAPQEQVRSYLDAGLVAIALCRRALGIFSCRSL